MVHSASVSSVGKRCTILGPPHIRSSEGQHITTHTTFQTGSETANEVDVDKRGIMFFALCAPPKQPGAASFYLFVAKDAAEAALDGAKNYRLQLPPHVPAKQFWAVTVYALETAAFFRDAPTVEVNSYQDMQKNADGSVDIFFGPKAPAGKGANWVYTAPGKQWISIFRFYGPEKAVHDKTWAMGDIELIAAQ